MKAVRLILFLLAIAPLQAIDVVSAARELAGRIAAKTGPAAITLDVRSSREDDNAAVRGRLTAELRALRVRIGEGKITVRVTLSESLRMAVWTAEILTETTRDIVMVERVKDDNVAQPGPRFSLERTLLLEQMEPILDVGPIPRGLAVLEPAAIMIYENGKTARTLPLDMPHLPSRDLRGRIVATPSGLRAYLPGVTCDAALDAGPAVCRRVQAAWPLDGVQATLAPGRNFFTLGKASFYSSATIDDQEARITVFAGTDGRTELRDFSSGDIVGVTCSGKRYLLAASATNEATVESYRAVNRHAVPVADPVEFFGPLTALWPLGDDAVAVARNRSTGRYAAYRLVLVCTP